MAETRPEPSQATKINLFPQNGQTHSNNSSAIFRQIV